MKSCLNCANLYLKKAKNEEPTCCTIGHWKLFDGWLLPQVLKSHKVCGDWSLLESMRGARGTKKEW